MNKNTLHLLLYTVFSLAALVIIIDFVSPGEVFNSEIVDVQKERQQSYNAARNYHYSYKLITNEHEILVSEDVGKLELTNKKIEYSVSPIFKEVNWYRLHTNDNKSYYSLRIASGIVLPFVTIILIFITYRYKKNIGTLVYIAQLLLIADLIYLIA